MNHEDQIDVLAFGAHPDDVELAAGGTVLKHVSMGKTVVIVDLTQGEMGTRGTVKDRQREANDSSKILGITNRVNLDLGDCFFEVSNHELIKVIEQIRRFRPKIVLCNAIKDRHPDHGRGGALVSRACYLSGLSKISTQLNGANQESHRPNAVYHYIQDRWIDPDIIVDVSDFFEDKLKAIKAFKSQFYDPNSKEPETPISGEDFLKSIKARAIGLGRYINKSYGEGFTAERYMGTDDLTRLL